MKHLRIAPLVIAALAACSKEPASAPNAPAAQTPATAKAAAPNGAPSEVADPLAGKHIGRKEVPEHAKAGELVKVTEYHDAAHVATERTERVGPDGKSRVRVGPMKVWHPNGKLYIEGQYDGDEKVPARKTGHWRYWDDQGQLLREGDYGDDMREGDWTENWPNGKPKSQGFIHVNLAEGPWKYWHENGQLMGEGEYVNNRREGTWLFYFPDGQADVVQSGRYEHGQKVQ